MHQIDDMDIRILGQLQRDGTLSVDALSERVDILAAADLELSADVMKACDAVTKDQMYPMG